MQTSGEIFRIVKPTYRLMFTPQRFRYKISLILPLFTITNQHLLIHKKVYAMILTHNYYRQVIQVLLNFDQVTQPVHMQFGKQ